jgi:glutathione S-transferase
MDVLVVWRQERLKPAERQTQDWLDTFALKIETALDQLDREAASLAGVPFDIGHVVIGCALGYLDFRFGDLNWRNGRPALTDWHAQFETRPSARATAPRKAA